MVQRKAPPDHRAGDGGGAGGSVDDEVARAQHDVLRALEGGALPPLQAVDSPVDTAPAARVKRPTLAEASEVEHSLVTTLRVSRAIKTAEGKLQREPPETVILPNRLLFGLDHRSTMAAIVDTVEKYAFGRPFFEVLASMALLTSILVVAFAADFASANVKALALLVAQFAAFDSVTMVVLAWFERCNLHQVHRTATFLMRICEVDSAVYSCSKLFRRSRYKKLLEAALEQVVNADQGWEPSLDPPRCEETSDPWRTELCRVLQCEWSDPDCGEMGDNSEIHDAVDAYLKFNNGCVVTGQRIHYCRNRGCHRDLQHVKDDAVFLQQRVVSLSCSSSFDPGKWLKSLSAPLFWARLELIHRGASSAISRISKLKYEEEDPVENAAADVDGAEALARLAGRRFRMARKWVVSPWRRYWLAMFCVISCRLETIVKTCFWTADILVSKSRRIVKGNPNSSSPHMQARLRKAQEKRKAMLDHCPLFHVRLAVLTFMSTAWAALKDPLHRGPAAIAQAFAPVGATMNDKCRKTRKCVLHMLAQIYFRFVIRHRAYPLRHIDIDGMDSVQLEKHYHDWVQAPYCCKSGSVDEPVSRHCNRLPVGQRITAFRLAIQAWLSEGVRPCTLREEHLHVVGQNLQQKGKKPLSFPYVVAGTVCKSIRFLWENTGFRCLTEARGNVLDSFRVVQESRKPAWTVKPEREITRQSAALAYGSKMLAACPEHRLCPKNARKREKRQELQNEFLDMNDADQDNFISGMKRSRREKQFGELSRRLDEPSEPTPNTQPMEPPLGLAGEQRDWPLHPNTVESFLGDFKQHSWERLEEVGAPAETIALYRKSRYPNRVRMAQLAIKTEFNKAVEGDLYASLPFVTEAIARGAGEHALRKTCQEKHYGVCQDGWAESYPAGLAFIRHMGAITKSIKKTEFLYDQLFRFTVRINDDFGDHTFTTFLLQCGGLLSPPIEVYIMVELVHHAATFGHPFVYMDLDDAEYPLRTRLVGRIGELADALEEPYFLTTGEVASHLKRLISPVNWVCCSITEEVLESCMSIATAADHNFGAAKDMPPPAPPVKKPAEKDLSLAQRIEQRFLRSVKQKPATKYFAPPTVADPVGDSDSAEDSIDEEELLLKYLMDAERRAAKGKRPFTEPGLPSSSDGDEPIDGGGALPPPPDIFPLADPPPLPPPAAAPPTSDTDNSDGSRAAAKKRTDFGKLAELLGPKRWPLYMHTCMHLI